MSQQDFLYIATRQSPLEILELFLQPLVPHPPVQRHCFEDWCDDYCDLEDVVLTSNHPQDWKIEDIEESYGITPGVVLEMADRNRDKIIKMQQELTGIVHLLKAIDGDMVFTSQIHGDVLFRKAGQLFMKRNTWYFDEPDFLKLIDMPYQVQETLRIAPED